ncbi:MAG: hypothetical protein O2782_10220 [bacterium]|nr:hypothetical protein [bacterium]
MSGLLLVALLATAGCGDGSSLGPRPPQSLYSEWVVQSAPEGMAETVIVDSVFWNPAVLLPTGDPAVLEVEGPFAIRLRNLGETVLELRYDLRFLDDGGFLVDRFIPFGQPVLLPPGQARLQQGTFVIRSPPEIGRFGLATMQIVARFMQPNP